MTIADPKISDAAYDKIIDHLSMMLEDEISDRIWDDISSFILKMTTDTDPRLEVVARIEKARTLAEETNQFTGPIMSSELDKIKAEIKEREG